MGWESPFALTPGRGEPSTVPRGGELGWNQGTASQRSASLPQRQQEWRTNWSLSRGVPQHKRTATVTSKHHLKYSKGKEKKNRDIRRIFTSIFLLEAKWLRMMEARRASIRGEQSRETWSSKEDNKIKMQAKQRGEVSQRQEEKREWVELK